MRKSIIKIIIAIALLSTIFAIGCSEKNAAKISFNESEIVLNVMQEKEISITVFNTQDALEWSVDNGLILKVVPAEDGKSAKLVGLKAGTTLLKVKNDDATASISVKVEQSSELWRLTLPENLSVLTGKEFVITPQLIYMDKELDAKFSFSSTDTSVATVSDDGKIVAGAIGETTVNVVAEYLGFTFNKSIAVSVVPEIEIISSCKEIEVYRKAEDSPYQSSQQFDVTILVDGQAISQSDISFDTIDHDIAIIENQNTLVGLNVGQTKIKVTFTAAEKEYSDYIFINVKELPQVEILLSNEKIVMYEYFREQQLSAKIFIDGEETDNGTIEFKSADDDIATIENGVVKAKANGKTTIDVCYNDGLKDYFTKANVEVKNSTSKAADQLGEGINGVTVELKEDKTVYFENEIDLSGSTKETSFIKLHILSQNQKDSRTPDVKYIFVRLTDAENSENYVTFKINASLTNANVSHVKVAANGNGYFGWRWGNGDPTDNLDSDSISGTYGEMGTRLPYYSMFQNSSDLTQSINLSFDVESQAAYAINGVNDYYLIFDLDTIVEHVNSVYDGFELFEGFATNKVKLSVYASGYSEGIDTCKLYIEEIAGKAADVYGIDKFKVR